MKNFTKDMEKVAHLYVTLKDSEGFTIGLRKIAQLPKCLDTKKLILSVSITLVASQRMLELISKKEFLLLHYVHAMSQKHKANRTKNKSSNALEKQ